MKQMGSRNQMIRNAAAIAERGRDVREARRRFAIERLGRLRETGVVLAVLYRGDQPFGKPKQMRWVEAMDENDRLRDKFWKDLDTNKAARLWRWKVIKQWFVEGGE